MNFYDILFQQQNAEKVPYSKSYFDTLFAQKFSNIKTLTGTLPLTFTTSETKLRSWTIYGADIEHEKTATGKSISFYTDEDKLRDWTIYGNAEGVGERTKNAIEIPTVSMTRDGATLSFDRQTGTAILSGDTTEATSGFSFTIWETSSLSAGEYIFSGGADGGSSTTYDLYLYNRTDHVIMGRLYSSSDTINATIENDKRYTVYVQCRKEQAYNDVVFKPMLRLADTTPEFIPYGYQIPLLVNDTETDIFIGSDPLTAGESVSKTSTGVDIATTDGNNTITTSLYNQPDMSIAYNEFTGVGLLTANLFMIALQVKAGGTIVSTFSILLTKPLRAGETLTSEQTGETIQTVAGVENKLSPSPKAASYGGNFDMKIKFKE